MYVNPNLVPQSSSYQFSPCCIPLSFLALALCWVDLILFRLRHCGILAAVTLHPVWVKSNLSQKSVQASLKLNQIRSALVFSLDQNDLEADSYLFKLKWVWEKKSDQWLPVELWHNSVDADLLFSGRLLRISYESVNTDVEKKKNNESYNSCNYKNSLPYCLQKVMVNMRTWLMNLFTWDSTWVGVPCTSV